jgi:hypothetical protein
LDLGNFKLRVVDWFGAAGRCVIHELLIGTLRIHEPGLQFHRIAEFAFVWSGLQSNDLVSLVEVLSSLISRLGRHFHRLHLWRNRNRNQLMNLH